MIKEIERHTIEYNSEKVVLSIYFSTDQVFFSIYDTKSLTQILNTSVDIFNASYTELIPYVKDLIGPNAVSLIITHQKEAHKVKDGFRLLLESSLHVIYNTDIFSTDRIYLSFIDISVKDADNIFSQITNTLKEFDNILVNRIRPYMCGFKSYFVTACGCDNIIRSMYRYIDICNETTVASDRNIILTGRSSIVELDIQESALKSMVANGVYTIDDAMLLNSSVVNSALAKETRVILR